MTNGTFTTNTPVVTTFNYSTQNSGMAFATFSTPLSNNYMVFFLSCLSFNGTQETTVDYPPTIKLTYAITSTTTYDVTVVFGKSGTYDFLHYTVIAFDKPHLENTGLFKVVHDRFNFSSAGGAVVIPSLFWDYAMMGLTDYSSTSNGKTMIHFELRLADVNNISCLFMPAAVPRDASLQPLSRYGFSLFYIMVPHCPAGYYYDIPSQLCYACPFLVHCQTCASPAACAEC